MHVARVAGRLYHSRVSEGLDSSAEIREGVLVLGVGNLMKGDDAVGPVVAMRLGARGAVIDEPSTREPGGKRIVALDCGTTPENYTSVIRRLRPQLLVIVDAAEMGLEAGQCRVIPRERVGSLGLSTHSMPLSLFMSYVDELVGEIILVGVQPHSMAFGAELSPGVVATAELLVECLERDGLRELPVLA